MPANSDRNKNIAVFDTDYSSQAQTIGDSQEQATPTDRGLLRNKLNERQNDIELSQDAIQFSHKHLYRNTMTPLTEHQDKPMTPVPLIAANPLVESETDSCQPSVAIRVEPTDHIDERRPAEIDTLEMLHSLNLHERYYGSFCLNGVFTVRDFIELSPERLNKLEIKAADLRTIFTFLHQCGWQSSHNSNDILSLTTGQLNDKIVDYVKTEKDMTAESSFRF